MIGNYAADLVNDNDKMKYYLFWWTSDPWIVMNGPLQTDGGVARDGEWVCKGVWLNDVPRAQRWFWIGDTEVVMRCQFVLCPKLELQEWSEDNDLPRMNAAHRASILSLNPLRLSDDNHDVLMDSASLREGLDYEEVIPFNTLESSDDDAETDDDEEEDDSEISEDEDQE